MIESHSEYILLKPMVISLGDSTKMLGSYSSFDVKTILNIKLILPANILGSAENSFLEYKINVGNFDVDFGIVGAHDF